MLTDAQLHMTATHAGSLTCQVILQPYGVEAPEAITLAAVGDGGVDTGGADTDATDAGESRPWRLAPVRTTTIRAWVRAPTTGRGLRSATSRRIRSTSPLRSSVDAGRCRPRAS